MKHHKYKTLAADLELELVILRAEAPSHLGSEELHDCDLAVHADLFDRPQTLSGDHIDLQTGVLGDQQVQILSRCEVTCREEQSS